MNSQKDTMTLMLIAILSACGGGNSDAPTMIRSNSGNANGATTSGTSSVLSDGNVNNEVTPANLLQTIKAPSYGATTHELSAFNEFNGFRRMMGLGFVEQSVKLDIAAMNHGTYMAANKVIAHQEDATKLNFTGIWPWDRQAFAGYTGTYSWELIDGGSNSVEGKFYVRDLMNTIYHKDGITDQQVTNIGFSFSSFTEPQTGLPDSPSFILTFELGYTGLGQNNASDFVTTYPIDKQTDLPLAMGGEIPNPFPDIGNSEWPAKSSSPVSIYSAKGTTLIATAFTVTENLASAPLNMRVVTKSNDVQGLVQSNAIHLVGYAPFKDNTKYNVSFTGSVNGKNLTKNWSFWTGTSTYIGGGVNQ